MLKVLHRVNNLETLASVPPNLGIEMDIHAYGSRLVVHHDAFSDGPDLVDWLDNYNHQLLIANIKEEGIESTVLELLKERGIEDFFLLDLSFPALMNTTRTGESRVALRISEYEPLEIAREFVGRAQWIWMDCFHGFPLSGPATRKLKTEGYKLCLVSPELHNDGRGEAEIAAIIEFISIEGLAIDAICTKLPNHW